ncbi:hypothetical protein L204_103721 [Cryptococcus depauperatus]|nr:hypothetical protein L204_02037 [Cryptococcus depauperatus CBS 7855]
MTSCLASSSSVRPRVKQIMCHICGQREHVFSKSFVLSSKTFLPKSKFSAIVSQAQQDVFGEQTHNKETSSATSKQQKKSRSKGKMTYRPLLRPPLSPRHAVERMPASVPLEENLYAEQRSEQALRGPWEPTKKLTFSAMAGLRTLHSLDPERFSRTMLSQKFGISREAVSRILRSKFREKSSENGNDLELKGTVGANRAGKSTLRGTKWDIEPETSEKFSPVLAILQAYGRSKRNR